MTNVDLLHHKIHICQSIPQVAEEHYFVSPKTGEERSATSPPSLAKILYDYIAIQPAHGPPDCLSTDPDDLAKPITYTRWFYVKVSEPVVRRSGLDPALCL